MSLNDSPKLSWILTRRGLLLLYSVWLPISICLSIFLHLRLALILSGVTLIVLFITHVVFRAIHIVRQAYLEEHSKLTRYEARLIDEMKPSLRVRWILISVFFFAIIGVSVYAIFWVGYNYNPLSSSVLVLLSFLLYFKLKGVKDDDDTYIIEPIRLRKLAITLGHLSKKFARDIVIVVMVFILCSLVDIFFVIVAKGSRKVGAEGVYLLVNIGATLILSATIFGVCFSGIVARKKWSSEDVAKADRGFRQFLGNPSNEKLTMHNVIRKFIYFLLMHPAVMASFMIGVSMAAVVVLPKMGGAGNLSEISLRESAGFVLQSFIDTVFQDMGAVSGLSVSSLRPEDIYARTYVFTLKYILIGLMIFYIHSVRMEMKLARTAGRSNSVSSRADIPDSPEE